jgi:hypothetical protein
VEVGQFVQDRTNFRLVEMALRMRTDAGGASAARDGAARHSWEAARTGTRRQGQRCLEYACAALDATALKARN